MPMRHTPLAALFFALLALEAAAQSTVNTVPIGTLDPSITTDPAKYQAMIGRLYYNNPHPYPGWEAIQGAARLKASMVDGYPAGGFYSQGRYLNHTLGGGFGVPRALDAAIDRSFVGPSYWPTIDPQDAPGARMTNQLPGLLGAGVGVMIGFQFGGGIGGLIGGIAGYVAGHALRKMLSPHQEFSMSEGGFVDPDPYNRSMQDFRTGPSWTARGSGTHGSTSTSSGSSGSSGFVDADSQLPGAPASDELEGLRSQYEETFQRYVEALETGSNVPARQQEYEAANARYQKALGR